MGKTTAILELGRETKGDCVANSVKPEEMFLELNECIHRNYRILV